MSRVVERRAVKINQAWVDAAPKGTHVIGDGLLLKTVEKGGRLYGSWIFRKQIDGVRRDFALGSSSKVKLADAKIAAGKARAAVAAGEDVREALGRKTHFKPNPDKWKLVNVIDRAFEAEKAGLKGDGKAGRWRSPLDLHVIPHLGNIDLEQITVSDIQRVLGKIWRVKSDTARKAANRLSKVLRFARLEGADTDERFVADAKALLGAQTHKPTHIPATPFAQIPSLYARICDLNQTPATLALRLTLLTAQRATPVRIAMLDQLDTATAIWIIPANALKGRKGVTDDLRVPLSSEAQNVVELATAHARGGKLFPAQYGGGFVSDVGMSKVLNKLGEAGRTHGLRSSFRDWCEHEDIPYDLAEMLLQHAVGSAVERAYRRDDRLDARTDVLERWAAFATSERDAQRRSGLRVV